MKEGFEKHTIQNCVDLLLFNGISKRDFDKYWEDYVDTTMHIENKIKQTDEK